MSYSFRDEAGEAQDSPLLFLFHGTGGDEHQFIDLGRQLLAAARLVAPRGDVSEGGALRYFKRTGEGRYDMADLGRAIDKLAEFVAAERRSASQMIALGYSNGANIIAATQFAHPELFDTVVLLHPLIPFVPPAAQALVGKAVLITAGRNDPICPPAATEALAAYYTAQGSVVTLVWHAGGHELKNEEIQAVASFLAPFRSPPDAPAPRGTP